VIRLAGMPAAPRGAAVKLDVLRWDEVDLTIETRLLEIEQAAPAADVAFEEEEELADATVAETVPELVLDPDQPADEKVEVAEAGDEADAAATPPAAA
jgi:exoribonuclease-2